MGGAADIGEALVPDLANVSKTVRKRRASKHDFRDGKGKVFAHRHENGGGWVADTAYVAGTVKVTRNAQVFDFAKIYGDCEIKGTARVFGHAQVHHSAQIYGTARVSGYAVIRNSVRLGHEVTVYGAALVGGVSTISGRVVIDEQAIVHNTYIEGPRKNALTAITGAAKVNDSRLIGYCRVNGAALVDRGNLTHVFVHNQARLSTVTISTVMPGNFWQWLNHGSGPWIGPPIEDSLSYIEGTVLSSYYGGPRLRMAENTLMARCHIPIEMYPLPPADNWPILQLENMDMLIRVENARSVDAARSRIHDGRNPLPTATPNIPQQTAYGGPAPIPVRGVAPDLGASRQRRLLQLGE